MSNRNFSLLPNVKTSPSDHPTCCLIGTGVIFPEVKRLGRQVDHSHHPTAGVKNEWNYNPTPHIHHHVSDRDNFTFTVVLLLGRRICKCFEESL